MLGMKHDKPPCRARFEFPEKFGGFPGAFQRLFLRPARVQTRFKTLKPEQLQVWPVRAPLSGVPTERAPVHRCGRDGGLAFFTRPGS